MVAVLFIILNQYFQNLSYIKKLYLKLSYLCNVFDTIKIYFKFYNFSAFNCFDKFNFFNLKILDNYKTLCYNYNIKISNERRKKCQYTKF